MMELKGKLVRWNEERGFGFIKSDSFNKDIFIHISALKTMARKPRINDVIYFELVTGKDSRKKAVNARIDGVSIRINNYTRSKDSEILTQVFFVILFIVAGSLVIFTISPFVSKTYNEIFAEEEISDKYNEIIAEEDFTGFSCQGKQYCNEMTSCKEARFYLKYCPDVKIDGDHDGVPCERQWCGQ